MGDYCFSFEKLVVYEESRGLVKDIYGILESFPKEERFALCDQVRRAAISIVSNIAEGSSRTSSKEQAHYLEISYGSLMEVYCQLQIATDLSYISDQQFNEIKAKVHQISKLLSGLRNHFRQP